MLKFRVPDMTCGHCAQAVEKAVKILDPSARVSVDLAEKMVTVETGAQAVKVAEAVRSAGYQAEQLAA